MPCRQVEQVGGGEARPDSVNGAVEIRRPHVAVTKLRVHDPAGPGRGEEFRVSVDPDYVRPALREQGGLIAYGATQIEDGLPSERRQRVEDGRQDS